MGFPAPVAVRLVRLEAMLRPEAEPGHKWRKIWLRPQLLPRKIGSTYIDGPPVPAGIIYIDQAVVVNELFF